MSEDNFSLDSLLEDLDAAVQSPKPTVHKGGTVKFVPHPPAKDKHASHTTTFNPKNRFAVDPSSAATSPDAPSNHDATRNSNRFAYGSPEKPQQSLSTFAPSSSQGKVSSHDTDENSIDNLLNLMGSPSRSQLPSGDYKAQSQNGSAFSYNNQTSTITSPLSSQFFLESQKIGSNVNAGHNGKFPSMSNLHDQSAYTTLNTNTTDTNNTYNAGIYNTQQYITADANISSPFDSPSNSSHGSAQKTSLAVPIHSGANNFANSVSMFNMNTNHGAGQLASPSYLANSFDSADSDNNNNSNNNNSNNKVPSIYNAMNGSPAATGKSGSGVNSALFGGAHGTHNNTHSTSSATSTYLQDHHSNSSNNSNALFPKSNTATFTSQNAVFKAHNEPKSDPKPSHFLPTSINATTIVSNAASSSSGSSSSSSSNGNGAKQKCSRVVIGGVSVPRGRKTSAFAHFACNNLRCLQCNFKVHCFTNSEWDASVDYMFLRNTVPNEAKLSVKLTRSAEKCAYCCQCSSASEGGERELNAQLSTQGPQWVCAGH